MRAILAVHDADENQLRNRRASGEEPQVGDCRVELILVVRIEQNQHRKTPLRVAVAGWCCDVHSARLCEDRGLDPQCRPWCAGLLCDERRGDAKRDE